MLTLTGRVSINTPIDVLIEISNAHDINFDYKKLQQSEIYTNSLIDTINTTPVHSITYPLHPLDIKDMAIFINKSCEWKLSQLNKAFSHLIGFFNQKSFSKIKPDFYFGLQTSNNPFTLNTCVIYTACHLFGLETKRNMSGEKLSSILRGYLLLPQSFIKERIIHDLNQKVEQHQLINIWSNLNQNAYLSINWTPFLAEHKKNNIYRNQLINFESLDNATTSIRYIININNVDINNFKNKIDAIVIAGLFYKMDISNVNDPFRELLIIRKELHEKHEGKLLSRINSRYKEIDSPYLDEVFNPKLPKSFYRKKQMKNLIQQEGIDPVYNKIDEYELLQTLYLIDTFFHGKMQNIKNKQTFIMYEDIEDLSFHSVVSYGIRHQSMYIFTYQELLDIFTKNKVFQNPASLKNEYFSDNAMKKLLYISKKKRYLGETMIEFNIRRNLTHQIQLLQSIINNIGDKAKQLLEIYNKSSMIIKSQINNAFNIFLELSMNMRGWIGSGPFPIKSASNYDQTNVDIRVSKSMGDFDQQCSKLGVIGERILNLPIVKFKYGIFSPSTSKDDGYSIKDRLYIVQHGVNSNNSSSCIRVTSNWFASTAYRYMNFLHHNPKFNIKELAHIS